MKDLDTLFAIHTLQLVSGLPLCSGGSFLYFVLFFLKYYSYVCICFMFLKSLVL